MPRRRTPRALPRDESLAGATNKYDAGGTGRRIAGWRPPSSGPQRAVESLPKIRDRARDAARNDWSAAAASQKWVTTLIGVGIRPRFKRVPEGPTRQAITDLWDDWTRVADHLYGTAPAPLTRRQRIGCWLAGWAPGLLGFGMVSAWMLMALRAH